jgi:hypothetical protein
MYRHKLATVLTFLLIITFSMPALSASVSGFVKQPSNRPAVGVVVTFTCPDRDPFPATTDQYGRYRVKGLPDVQWCSLSVNYEGEDSTPVRINSGSGSRETNIKLKNSESGLTVTL